MNSRQLMASLARKTLVFIAMMFLLSLIVFYVSRLTPGDPLQSFYGDAMQSMTTTELDAARERLGLNGPIWIRQMDRERHAGGFRHLLEIQTPRP